jgi:hypothetical protein
VHSHALPEALLDDRGKRAVCGEREGGEGEVGGNGAARERAGVVRLKVRQLLRLIAFLEVGVRLVGLALTGRCQQRIGPDGRAIPLLLSPVALWLLVRSQRALSQG